MLNAEFQVNTHTDYAQSNPDITTLDGGSFVITWQSNNQIGFGYDTFAKIYDAQGNVESGEIQINSQSYSHQQDPSIAAINGGGFVVAWESYQQDGSGYGVYTQIFDEYGAKVGTELLVNTTTSESQKNPSVSALGEGGFVINWESQSSGVQGYDIYSQIFSNDGIAVGGEFVVNSTTGGAQTSPIITELSGGEFVIAWQSDTDLYAQMYDANGSAIGDEFIINTFTANDQKNADIIALSDGGFMLSWQSNTQDKDDGSDDNGIYSQIYDASGNAITNGFIANENTDYSRSDAKVAVLNDGGFVLTWAEGLSAHGQRYDVDGNAIGVEILLSSYSPINDIAPLSNGGFMISHYIPNSVYSYPNSGDYIQLYDQNSNKDGSFHVDYASAYNAKIAEFSDGRFIVTWLDGNGLYAQLYDVDGNVIGDYFYVITTGYINKQDVTVLNDNSFVVTWDYSSSSYSSSNDDIQAKHYDAEANPTGDTFTVNTYASNAQKYSNTTALSDGGFLVTWTSYSQPDGSYDDIYAQRYDAESNTIGDEFLINTHTAGTQSSSQITALGDGGFVVTWLSQGQDNNGSGLYAQLFDDSANKVGEEFNITGYISGEANIASLGYHEFIVTWSYGGQIYTKILGYDGSQLSTIVLDTSTPADDTDPTLATFTMLNNINENTTTINEASLFFDAEIVSAYQASNAIYGEDLSTNPSEKLIKLTLNADITKLSDTSITSIAAAGLDIGLDWSQFEVINYNDNSTQWFDSKSQTSNYFEVRQDITTSKLESVVVASLDISSTPSLTLVDGVTTNGAGEVDHPSILKVGDVYLNPINSLNEVSLTYGGSVVTNQGDSQFVQATKSLEVNTKPIDAIISIDSSNVLVNTNVEAYKAGVDQSVSTEVSSSGEMWFHQSVDIDEVKLSDSDVYNFDTSINISDAIDVLRHIVNLETLTPGSNGFHAADVDNDGNINISDAIDILRHIVNLESIDTFDLLDTNGDRVTEFDADSSGVVPTWTLVANGDVDSSGGFNDDYVVTVDIV